MEVIKGYTDKDKRKEITTKYTKHFVDSYSTTTWNEGEKDFTSFKDLKVYTQVQKTYRPADPKNYDITCTGFYEYNGKSVLFFTWKYYF